jgi:hypothetical protein
MILKKTPIVNPDVKNLLFLWLFLLAIEIIQRRRPLQFF